MTIKGKAWSHGTNSRLLFGVNVNLNFTNVKGFYSFPLHLAYEAQTYLRSSLLSPEN